MKNHPATPCPVCQATLSNSFHRRLNRFWSGTSVANCPNCETTLEYEGGLKAKLKRAGILTRIGIVGLVVSIAFRIVGDATDLTVDALIGLSFVLLMAGILMSATKPDQINVVVSESTE